MVDFLGHELTERGFNISKRKVCDVLSFRRPHTITELKSFLGLATFLAAYIQNFADISKPLWDATSGSEFEWCEQREEAFVRLKEAIASCTVRILEKEWESS